MGGELHPTSTVFSHFTSMARLTTLALGIMLRKPITLLGVQLMLMLTGITKEVKGSGAPVVPIASFQRPLICIPPRPQPLQRPPPRPQPLQQRLRPPLESARLMVELHPTSLVSSPSSIMTLRTTNALGSNMIKLISRPGVQQLFMMLMKIILIMEFIVEEKVYGALVIHPTAIFQTTLMILISSPLMTILIQPMVSTPKTMSNAVAVLKLLKNLHHIM